VAAYFNVFSRSTVARRSDALHSVRCIRSAVRIPVVHVKESPLIHTCACAFRIYISREKACMYEFEVFMAWQSLEADMWYSWDKYCNSTIVICHLIIEI
jgi:hypothetical protein